MNKKGYILLEILVSLMILGTVLVVTIQGISGYVRKTSKTVNLNVSAALAQQLVTKIKLNEFKTGVNEGELENTNFRWVVNKSAVSKIESQYNVFIKWIEQGTGQEWKFTLNKYEFNKDFQEKQ
jgi:type II secretory pathway pseudopilin PulG